MALRIAPNLRQGSQESEPGFERPLEAYHSGARTTQGSSAYQRRSTALVSILLSSYGSIILWFTPEVMTCWLLFPLGQVISSRA